MAVSAAARAVYAARDDALRIARAPLNFHHVLGRKRQNFMFVEPPNARRSFRQMLRDTAQEARGSDQHPWLVTLKKLKGKIGHDGIERVSTSDVFDALEVSMRRRASLTVQLSRMMGELGWRNIRARGLKSWIVPRSSARVCAGGAGSPCYVEITERVLGEKLRSRPGYLSHYTITRPHRLHRRTAAALWGRKRCYYSMVRS